MMWMTPLLVETSACTTLGAIDIDLAIFDLEGDVLALFVIVVGSQGRD